MRRDRPIAAVVTAPGGPSRHVAAPLRRTALPAALLVVALAGCAGPASPGRTAEAIAAPAPDGDSDDAVFAPYAAASAAGRRVVRLDPAASTVRAYVFRAGRAARLGHNHVVSAVDFTGACLLDAEDLADARCDLSLRLDRLELDRAELRAALGPAFASTVSPEAVAATRTNMLGDGNLQAARHPSLRLRVFDVVGELPKPVAQVEITLHGERRTQWLALDVRGLPERLQVRGSFVLRQSDFGIAPFSVANGLLAVKDEIAVEFDLVGR